LDVALIGRGSSCRWQDGVVDVAVGVGERELAGDAVTREVALLKRELEALGRLFPGVEAGDEPFLDVV